MLDLFGFAMALICLCVVAAQVIQHPIHAGLTEPESMVAFDFFARLAGSFEMS